MVVGLFLLLTLLLRRAVGSHARHDLVVSSLVLAEADEVARVAVGRAGFEGLLEAGFLIVFFQDMCQLIVSFLRFLFYFLFSSGAEKTRDTGISQGIGAGEIPSE